MDTIERTEILITSPTKLLTPAVTVILVLMIIGFGLSYYAPAFTSNNLAIAAVSVFHGKIWELITYTLINPPAWNLIFNGMIVLFMGSCIEREWRTKSFLALWFVTAIVCALIWIVISVIVDRPFLGAGTDACAYGIIATFGILYRGTRMWFYFFTIEAQVLAIILIVVGAVISIVQPMNLIWVSGALVAYFYVKLLRWHAAPRPNAKAAPQKHDISDGFVDID